MTSRLLALALIVVFLTITQAQAQAQNVMVPQSGTSTTAKTKATASATETIVNNRAEPQTAPTTTSNDTSALSQIITGGQSQPVAGAMPVFMPAAEQQKLYSLEQQNISSMQIGLQELQLNLAQAERKPQNQDTQAEIQLLKQEITQTTATMQASQRRASLLQSRNLTITDFAKAYQQ